MKEVGPTWKEVVRDALEALGGKGHLSKINERIKGHEKAQTRTWKATIRRTLQQYSIFYQEEPGSGIWFLKGEEPIREFDPEEHPHPGHSDVMGMLLELGRIYDFETTVSPYERKEEFLERTLEDLATLEEVPSFSGYPEVLENARGVDVMWFGGETDRWNPRYAFEVEHTTKFTKGLARLNDLYGAGIRIKPFVIVPEDKLDKAKKELSRDTFKNIHKICRIQTYRPLINLYTLAQKHRSLKTEFLES
ncbi:hypothetical protein AKJ45_03100 [candidate division MSBL1 archaeon SCGC-AAA261F19]|uniref:Restriction system protein Mrr-like N-terminal domain-containing protein n=6 Tax=candidate division MSBL1 TaxID=215777 RepID=A0A133V0X8_9EURY|nr:hypothetical protein AKJ42_01755 [candidate division MSBL1 archaeon SCGC-AAA261C02]KXB02003.1 hypothetical protein AKJ43_02655 [candidate division MSBL1 archaeon SCGC-AAA261D19]KXB02918.1 hypothetical protein AKJ45_03100 [candidate division MSBL1 archaeon SCGC-AAA261F19]KXB03550.1 hypothetical protein AKJ47_02065 [candidate division MSBL1 archaeon SCGC-AAA261G05]KXB04710.1 hypothetical protein AKJ48_01630 [candidate division MSBL1 archaeon SCGC-AAA261O19]KXB09039.1 hypothetical protein AKJ4